MPFSRTEPNVPNYVEDPNSPFTVTGQTSATFTLAEPSDNVLILSDPAVRGYGEMQVNGVTDPVYDYLDNADTFTINATKWEVPTGESRSYLVLRRSDSRVGFTTERSLGATSPHIAGDVGGISGPVTQFTMINAFGNPTDGRLRVYSINV